MTKTLLCTAAVLPLVVAANAADTDAPAETTPGVLAASKTVYTYPRSNLTALFGGHLDAFDGYLGVYRSRHLDAFDEGLDGGGLEGRNVSLTGGHLDAFDGSLEAFSRHLDAFWGDYT